uniref:G-protein coupled receptors family 1 profile domain-containing protein n=1 Tax=Caenorhabditis japonica TaxID=281687 RepID=A0A2Q4SVZ1_CAEJA
METVTMHAERKRLQSVVYYSKYIYYFFLFVILVILQFNHALITEQTEFKGRMEQRYGKLPSFVWCESCFFLQLDTVIAVISIPIGFFTLCCVLFSAICASLVSFRTLNSAAVRWSPKTKAIQKNMLVSLIISVLVLFFFIIFPLFVFTFVNFVMINSDGLAYFMILMMEEHGTAATLITFLTNKLLMKELKNIVKCCGKKKSIQGSTVISM